MNEYSEKYPKVPHNYKRNVGIWHHRKPSSNEKRIVSTFARSCTEQTIPKENYSVASYIVHQQRMKIELN